MITFSDSDGGMSMRPVTYGEIADALCDLPQPREEVAAASAAPQPAPDPRLATAIGALRRIAATTGCVVDTAALWKIAGDALDEMERTPQPIDPNCTVCAQAGGTHGMPQPELEH